MCHLNKLLTVTVHSKKLSESIGRKTDCLSIFKLWRNKIAQDCVLGIRMPSCSQLTIYLTHDFHTFFCLYLFTLISDGIYFRDNE